MSRQAFKAINWAALAERVPEAEKAALAAFKSKSDKYLQRMMANPEALPKIDWAHYKKVIVTPGLVDKFQKEYESLSIPYPADNYTAEIEAAKSETVKKIESFIQEVDVDIEKIRNSLNELNNMIPFSEMTIEDFVDLKADGCMHPDKITTWPHDEASQEHNSSNEDSKESSSGH